MKKSLSVMLILVFFLLSTVTLATAGPGYYHYGYGNYPPRYHYSPSYHHYSHSYHADSYLPLLGIGLVAGAVAGSLMYEPPRHQAVVFKTAPPMIVQTEPLVVNSRVPSVPPPPEFVLRQVKITERIVNVRSGPGLDSTIIGQVTASQTVDVIGAAPEWLYIRTGAGQYGWVMSQYTAESAEPVG